MLCTYLQSKHDEPSCIFFIHAGNGEADRLDILDLESQSKLKSFTFRKEPNHHIHPYWNGYELNKFRRDLASISWCIDKVILVVSFEWWNREKVNLGAYRQTSTNILF